MLNHDSRARRRAGAATLGFGLALTIAGAALLGSSLHDYQHAPKNDFGGAQLNDVGLAFGSAFLLQSGLAAATAGAVLVGVRF